MQESVRPHSRPPFMQRPPVSCSVEAAVHQPRQPLLVAGQAHQQAAGRAPYLAPAPFVLPPQLFPASRAAKEHMSSSIEWAIRADQGYLRCCVDMGEKPLLGSVRWLCSVSWRWAPAGLRRVAAAGRKPPAWPGRSGRICRPRYSASSETALPEPPSADAPMPRLRHHGRADSWWPPADQLLLLRLI